MFRLSPCMNLWLNSVFNSLSSPKEIFFFLSVQNEGTELMSNYGSFFYWLLASLFLISTLLAFTYRPLDSMLSGTFHV
jgi:hypothetical protein